MHSTTHKSSSSRVLTWGNITNKTTSPIWRFVAAVAMLACLLATSAQAQTVRFNTPHWKQTRITIPPSFSGTYVLTNSVTVSSIGGVPVELIVTGLPGSGAALVITDTNGAALPITSGNPSTTQTTNIWLTFTFTSPPNGTYPMVLKGIGGATNEWPFVLQVAPTWNSPTSNVTGGAGAAGDWSTAANWQNSAAPTATDDVVFSSGTAEAFLSTNCNISGNVTIASLRYSQMSNNFAWIHGLHIDPNMTLSITGTNGFSMLRDFAPATGSRMLVSVAGDGNATLAVSNEAALYAVQAEGNTMFTNDMSKLDNLKVNVSRVALGDYQAYPNFTSYVISNSYGDTIKQFVPSIYLARTNIIRATYADPQNYTNGGTRSYGFCIGNNYAGGSGSTPNLLLYFGVTNSIYADGVCFIHAGCQSTAIGFDPRLTASSPSALFRGTNGGRMSIMALADFASFTNISSGSTPKATVNFITGTLDVLVDRFYMALDRFNSQGAGPSATLNMGAGVFDCNTAILGYESYGIHTNTDNCQATMLVSNGTFRVNNSLILGYTTDPAGVGAPQNTFGKLTLWGGTNYINSVSQGGVTKLSTGNAITLTNGAMLVVSNTLCDASKFLDNLNFGGGKLGAFLNSTSTTPVVYASAWNFPGAAPNTFVLMGIKNPGGLVNNQEIPLFKKSSGAFPTLSLVNLSGVNGSIVTDGGDANQQNFKVILNTPKNIVWKGNSSAIWDNVTTNWQDTSTGLYTNFLAGDNVRFDDTASQFSISLDSGSVILPGSVLVTNVANAYTINSFGGGSIIGSVTLTKTGGNSLTIDAPCSDAVQLNNGSLKGAGSVGSITADSGTVVDFTGSINGNLDVAGTANSSGTVVGTVTVEAGAVVTNNGTMNNSFNVNTNGLFVNNLGANLANIGSSAVSAGGTFVNRSTVVGANLSISGTFLDTGEGNTTLTGTLTANTGSTIIPGGNGVGTTTIASGVAAGFPGRILLSQGSTSIFKVAIVPGVSTNYTVLKSGYQDFGGSSSARSQSGCTLVISNTAGSFANGQYFALFQYSGGGAPSSTGQSTNTYPVISPLTPGPGLVWDMTQLWPAGLIGVITPPVITLTNSFAANPSNVIADLSWDPALLGYRVQTLVATNTLGLSATNWANVPGSWTNTAVSLTNTIIPDNSVFYRLSFP